VRGVRVCDVSEQRPPHPVPSGDRNILIYLSEQATLKAVRADGSFHILVGDDVEIRGVSPDHMAGLVGSVMDAFVPADMASRVMDRWMTRRVARIERRAARREEREAKRDHCDRDEPAG
jgi:hypothetical protein